MNNARVGPTNVVPGMTLYMQPVQDLTLDNTVSRTQYNFTLESADAALLATHIDDTVVVVDATRTKARVLVAAQALLVRTGASIRGLLLNKVASQDKV